MNKIKTILFSFLCALATSGCYIVEFDTFIDEKKDFDDVMIFCAVGRNDLHSYLKGNIAELQEGFIPSKTSRKAIVMVTNLFISGFSSEITCPYVIRLYSDEQGQPVLDTLKAWSHEDRLTSVSSLNSILSYVKDTFDSASYGLVYSSHGSGWLPEGYYNISGNTGSLSRRRTAGQSGGISYEEEQRPEGFPLTKSMGRELYKQKGAQYAYEMTSQGLADALPFHLDYLVLDLCFMGGVEVAYDLKDKCSYILASQAEILAAGFNYRTMSLHLLNGQSPDLAAVAQDYFDKYKDESGAYRSATISLIDCSKLDGLAFACIPLFSKYRDAIAGLDGADVQPYFVHDDAWFFDLEDMLLKAGINEAEKRSLKAAIDRCIIYKACTERILDKVDIGHFCGFSTYLPSMGTRYLDDYYKTLAWNKATGFVE